MTTTISNINRIPLSVARGLLQKFCEAEHTQHTPSPGCIQGQRIP